VSKVLLVDDDPKLLRLVEHELAEAGIESLTAETGKEALRRLKEEEPIAVVLDLLLPDIAGKDLLARLRRERPELPVVVLTAQGGVDDVVECMKLGAVDYVQKPFDAMRLVTSIRNAKTHGVLRARVRSLADELHRGEGFDAIVGRSKAIRAAVDLLRRAAQSDVTVLLEGESGTGKEVAARAVHAESTRRTGPFVAVNCGAIPEGLIESELFGHEKGSFTGATEQRPGRFEQADGGTLFLDEVGELRLDLQVKLLRVLQERQVTRVGAGRARPVDVRVIAATHRDLKGAVGRGGFREDLYYRLAVFPVRLPPLRERGGDILLLADVFVRRFAERHRKRIAGITAEARQALEAHAFPGNVRELENVLERAVILEDGDTISLGSLPDDVVCALDATRGVDRPGPAPGAAAAAAVGIGAAAAVPPPPGVAPREPPLASPSAIIKLEDEERRVILRALEATAWNLKETAARLGIGRATLYRKIERFGLALGRAPP